MKLTLTLAICLAALASNAGEINFIDGSLDEARAQAKAQSKLIFTDFYATWCGPCLKMQRSVFVDPEVIEFFNKNFINLKIDVDEQEPELVQQVGISSIPALFFLDADGNVVFSETGYKDAADFIAMGQSVLAYSKNTTGDYRNLKGAELVSFLRIYQQTHEEEAQKIAENALQSYSKVKYRDENAWYLMRNFVNRMDHPAFLAFASDVNWFYETYDTDASDFWYSVFSSEMDAIANSRQLDRLEQLTQTEIKLKTALDIKDKDDDYYRLENKSIYYGRIDDEENYAKTVEALLVTYHNDNSEMLSDMAVDLLKREGDPSLKLALKLSGRAYELDQSARIVAVHCIALAQNDQAARARKLLEAALKDSQYDEYDRELLEKALDYVP